MISKFIRTLVVFGIGLAICAVSMVQGRQEDNFKTLLVSIRKEARDRGVSRKTLDAAFNGLEPIPEVIERDRNQPESKLTLDEYLDRIITQERVSRGRAKLDENRNLLAKVSERYGVQSEVIVALWGIETYFGRGTGDFPVIGSLATLVYEGRRSSMFRKQLMHALRILDDGHIPLEHMKGSWAGAMGQLQFMPSTFRMYALDFDGDGHIDVWRSLPDAFASAANYLSRAGWRPEHSWGHEVRLPRSLDLGSIGLKQSKRTSEWHELGVRTLGGLELQDKDLLSSVVLPDGPSGRAFLVHKNYEVILKWNRSHNFAIAVGILSDRIGN